MDSRLLFFSFISPFLAGAVGSIFTFSAIPVWYESLNKPSFSPPNFVFGPVWTMLYILMGVSFYLVFSKAKTKEVKKDLILIYTIQLILNALWSIAFFGLRSPFLGVVVIISLWLAIVVMVIKFFRVLPLASALNLPYFLWVSFAAYLNFWIYYLNL